jgi:hypothetical protein
LQHQHCWLLHLALEATPVLRQPPSLAGGQAAPTLPALPALLCCLQTLAAAEGRQSHQHCCCLPLWLTRLAASAAEGQQQAGAAGRWDCPRRVHACCHLAAAAAAAAGRPLTQLPAAGERGLAAAPAAADVVAASAAAAARMLLLLLLLLQAGDTPRRLSPPCCRHPAVTALLPRLLLRLASQPGAGCSS